MILRTSGLLSSGAAYGRWGRSSARSGRCRHRDPGGPGRRHHSAVAIPRGRPPAVAHPKNRALRAGTDRRIGQRTVGSGAERERLLSRRPASPNRPLANLSHRRIWPRRWSSPHALGSRGRLVAVGCSASLRHAYGRLDREDRASLAVGVNGLTADKVLARMCSLRWGRGPLTTGRATYRSELGAPASQMEASRRRPRLGGGQAKP